MALIFCPECRKQISDQSVSCPNCGYPLRDVQPSKIVLKKKEGCFLQTLNLGCLVVLIMLGIAAAVVVLFVTFPEKFNKTKPTIETVNKKK